MEFLARIVVMRDNIDKPVPLRSPRVERGAAEAEYLESMCVELAAMAEKARFKELAEMLGAAVHEAHRVALRHNLKVDRDESASA